MDKEADLSFNFAYRAKRFLQNNNEPLVAQ